jgi:hypothetical protein
MPSPIVSHEKGNEAQELSAPGISEAVVRPSP